MIQKQQQQQSMHPLSTVIPHPSVTLQHSHSPSRTSSSNMIHQDGPPTSPIDFTNHDALFMSPLSRASQLDDFEDLDYQSGLTNYQKQHLGLRHPAIHTSMDIQQQQHQQQHHQSNTTASSTIPIHQSPMKQQGGLSYYASAHGDYDTNLTSFPMSAPANFGGSSFGGDPTPPPPPSTSTSSLLIQQPSMDSPGSTARSFEEDDYSLQMNMQLMMDKRRRRRESHNAVERRRRENINERIQELGTLLPEIMAEPANNKPNKGAILRHSVDHIRQLQQQVQSYSQRVKELETTLARLQSK